jgi:hypothetical protein
VHLIDLEQRVLVPVPGPGAAGREVLSVHGTLAGRCFASTTLLDTAATGGRRVWLPLLDGTERVGVLELVVGGRREPLPSSTMALLERLAHFIAILVVSKNPYSDHFELLRRRRPMTTATELLRHMVPPQVLATDDFVLAAMLEPAYDNGGDTYDYALNGGLLHATILDGIGHGLAAAGLAAFALAVARRSRRAGEELPARYGAIDREVAEQYPDSRYATGCLAELDVGTGRLRWVNAGHPAPLLLRGGRFVKELEVQRSPPMGLLLAAAPPVVGEASLEPGDMVLLYTDGLVEARRPDGSLFTAERLAEFIERQAAGGGAAPETLRQLREAIIERGEGALRDDATALLIEWRRGTQGEVVPPTVR